VDTKASSAAFVHRSSIQALLDIRKDKRADNQPLAIVVDQTFLRSQS